MSNDPQNPNSTTLECGPHLAAIVENPSIGLLVGIVSLSLAVAAHSGWVFYTASALLITYSAITMVVRPRH